MLEVKNEEIRPHFQDGRWDYMDCDVSQATVTNLGTLRINVDNRGGCLKKSGFLKKVENRLIENVQETEKNRL